MPFPLTRKELEYVLKLVSRNMDRYTKMYRRMGRVDEAKFSKLSEGLEEPMTPRERKLRERIRMKAYIMTHLIGAISLAGIYPDKKNGIGRNVSEVTEAWWMLIVLNEGMDDPDFIIHFLEKLDSMGIVSKEACAEALVMFNAFKRRISRFKEG